MASKVARAKRRLSGRLSSSISELLSVHRRSQCNLNETENMGDLHQAALMGNVSQMRLLLEAGAKVNQPDDKGMIALHYAVLHNQVEPCSFLIKNGAEINAVNQHGNTPIHIACQSGYSEVMNLLLYFRADVNSRNSSCKSPLDLAAEYGRLKVVDTLLNANVLKPNTTMGSSDAEQQFSRSTPLHLASRNGHIDVLKLLLETSYDVNRCALHGSALHEAVNFGRLDVVLFLLRCGADPELPDPTNRHTPLDLARKSRSENARDIRLLLKKAIRSAFGRATADNFSSESDALLFSTGDIVWIFERPDDLRWKGVIFGPKYTNTKSGYFPASSIQIIDRQVAMQRSASQRQVKKVSVPMVPDVATTGPGSLTPKMGDGRHSATSSYGSMPSDAFNDCISIGPMTSHGRIHNSPHLPTGAPYSPRHGTNGHSFNFNGRTNSPDQMAPSPRHRNSTASSGSQASSGFESMKSNSNPFVNAQVHTLRGESPPNSRNSYHSSGSSSLGSLERLEESGLGGSQCTINVTELMVGGQYTDIQIVRAWLESLNFTEYTNLFLEAGYDIVTISRMTPGDLTAVGITKPGHRKRLATEIKRLNLPDFSLDVQPTSVSEWLQQQGLLEYLTAFEKQCPSLEKCRQLSWEDFEDFGIQKLGHQKKLSIAIKKLRDAAQPKPVTQAEPNARLAGEVLVINVPPSNGGSGHGTPTHNGSSTPKMAEVRPFNHHPPTSTATNGMRTFTHQQVAVVNGSPRLKASRERLMYDSHSQGSSPIHSSAQNGATTFITYGEVHHHNGNMSHSAYDTLPSKKGLITPQDELASLPPVPLSSSTLERPKVSVKPVRPVAKIVAKTKRNSREIPQDIIYYNSSQDLPDEPRQGQAGSQNYVNVTITQQFCINGSSNPDQTNGHSNDTINAYNGTSTNVFINGNGYEQQQDQATIKSLTNGPARLNGITSPATRSTPLLSRKGPPPPPKRFNAFPPPQYNSGVFQLSPPEKPPLMLGLSPAPSLENFPPPPGITCEQSIAALKTLREQPGTPSSCLSTPASEFVDLQCSTSSSSTPGHVSQVSSDSTGNTSDSGIPFANENVGTIKQKSPRGATPGTTTNGGVVMDNDEEVVRLTGKSISSPRKSVQGLFATQEPDSLQEGTTGRGQVFDEIGDMLQGLTDELDAMLTIR